MNINYPDYSLLHPNDLRLRLASGYEQTYNIAESPANDDWTTAEFVFTATASTETLLLSAADVSGDVRSATVIDAGIDPLLTKSVSPTSINSGDTATYTWTVDNRGAGTQAVNGMSFTDTLPTAIVVASNPNVQGNCSGTSFNATASGNIVTVSGIDLAADTFCTISVDITNVSGQSNPDCTSKPIEFTNGSDNITAVTGMVEAITPESSACLEVIIAPATTDLSITKTASVDPVTAGVPFDYVITVTNTGSNEATNVVVEDDVDASLTSVTATASSSGNTTGTNGNHVECHWATLAAGVQETCTINVTP